METDNNQNNAANLLLITDSMIDAFKFCSSKYFFLLKKN